MNSTNSTNETFYSLDYWYNFYGYPYTGDILAAYAITPLWILSFALSLFSLLILRKPPFFASNFFNYMRLYVANCLILSVTGLTTIIGASHRFFSITNTYEAVYYTFFLVFIANILILYSSSIEICLIVERILYFLPKRFKKIKLIGFKKFFFILLMLCMLANLPSMFLFETAFEDVQLDTNKQFRIWYIGITAFSQTSTGQILNYIGNILRDILPMILKLILNSLSLYLVRRYVKEKQKIKPSTPTADSHIVNFDRKQTFVAIAMNTFSLLEHLLYITSYIFYFINNFDLGALLIVIALLIISIKHFCIFFILLLFNNLFRNEVKKLFKCSV